MAVALSKAYSVEIDKSPKGINVISPAVKPGDMVMLQSGNPNVGSTQYCRRTNVEPTLGFSKDDLSYPPGFHRGANHIQPHSWLARVLI